MSAVLKQGDVHFKVLVGPSPHYYQLQSGEIRYQKKKPARPLWRILVVQEPEGLLKGRLFAEPPTAAEIEETVWEVLSSASKSATSALLVPDTVERLSPGIRDRLDAAGVRVFLPTHGFAAGARESREWEKVLVSLLPLQSVLHARR